jgi:hypothetical protein
MFNRVFCYLFLAIVGLNLVCQNINLKAQIIDPQKPYISEEFKNNATLPETCYNGKVISTYPRGLCHTDIWIEITNPTKDAINLDGYQFDFRHNYKKNSEEICSNEEDMFCRKSIIKNLSIQANSQILFAQSFGGLISSLKQTNVEFTKLTLVYPNNNINESSYNFNLLDPADKILESHNIISQQYSTQFCVDSNGNKSHSSDKPSTPGLPNDCPEVDKVEAPLIPIIPIDTSKNTKDPELAITPIANLEQTQQPTEVKIPDDNKILDKPKDKVDNILNLDTKSLPAFQATTIQQPQALPITNIEIKTEPKIETKKVEPKIVATTQEPTIIQTKADKASETQDSIKTEIVDLEPIEMNLVLAESERIVELVAAEQEVVQKPITKAIEISIEPAIISHTKVVQIVDDQQTQNSDKPITKIATVDMLTVKLYSLYFNLTLILFLLTKTTLQNKQPALKLLDLVRQKLFSSK